MKRFAARFSTAFLVILSLSLLAGCEFQLPDSRPSPTKTTAPSCPTETTQEEWVSEQFWHSIDLSQLQIELQCDADINTRGMFYVTPLHLAAKSNQDPAVIQALLDAGADPNATDEGAWTPLHSAARHNENHLITQMLLDAGADIHARDASGQTPLHVAAWGNKNPAVSHALLDAGADVEAVTQNNLTALHRAASSNENEEVIKALLEGGANIKAEDDQGKTPLQLALESNPNPAVIQVLQEPLLAEYAKACADLADEYDGAQDSIEAYEEVTADFKKLNPPEELQLLHDLIVDAAELSVEGMYETSRAMAEAAGGDIFAEGMSLDELRRKLEELGDAKFEELAWKPEVLAVMGEYDEKTQKLNDQIEKAKEDLSPKTREILDAEGCSL